MERIKIWYAYGKHSELFGSWVETWPVLFYSTARCLESITPMPWRAKQSMKALAGDNSKEILFTGSE
ncbi:MAG TPA: hypothetical protein VJ943_12555 [Desulfotignum sp.]|nr:hypothetical protein [Desulfotignum sp.]